jgi:sigma-B regulation protein RsbU (phosphoserine phosphatase)
MSDEQLEGELLIARRVMDQLLPHETPEIRGFDTAASNLPSRDVGGDYYEFIPLADDRWGIATADVVGKGIAAALLVAAVRASLCSLVGLELAQRAIMRRMNAFLYHSMEGGKFVTLFYCVLDVRTCRLIYVNAGHLPPILLRSSGDIELLEEAGVPLGLFADARYAEGFTALHPGDVLALYTDGITDAMDEREQLYGRDRLIASLLRWRRAPAAEMCRECMRDVEEYGRGQASDDRTLVILRAVG